jgi:hypothetical protein
MKAALSISSANRWMPLWPPAYRLLKRLTVALDSRRVLDVDGAAAELEVFGGVLSMTDGGLHEAAGSRSRSSALRDRHIMPR